MTPAQIDYAVRFASLVVGKRLDRHELDEATCRLIFHELSRTEEIDQQSRDQWGSWDWQYNASQRRGDLYRPFVDLPLRCLRESLHAQDIRTEPLWPDNHPFAICLTHDVDVVSSLPSPRSNISILKSRLQSTHWRSPSSVYLALRAVASYLRNILRSRLPPHVHDPLWHYEDWIDLESKYGWKSTFYIFPTLVAARHPWDCTYTFDDPVVFQGEHVTVREMIRRIDQLGWEIGLHGSFHSATDAGLLADQKRQVESIIAKPVISTRQHWLHYDVAHTPTVHSAAGLLSDSTQGFNRSIGFRSGTSFPYWCWDHAEARALSVLEIPLHIMDGPLFSTSGLEYDAELATQHVLEILERVEQVGGCLTVNFHPNYLNDPAFWQVYNALLAEASRRNGWGCSAGQLFEWWTARESRILGEE